MKRRGEWALTLPPLGWLVAFFAIPSVLILVLALRPSDLRGGIGEGWTFATVRQLADPIYLPIAWRTVWLSAVTTGICIAFALPMSWCMARLQPRWRNLLVLLVIVPFLTNFLIRIFAWRSLLHPEGPLKHLLVWLHLATDNTILLNNAGAVLLVLVYTQLPFAILPLFAAAEKFDFTLIDAARDLGAGAFKAFRTVFLPAVRAGILSASIIVFVSALGQYVIPQFIGGTDDEMIGNKIAQRAFADRNLPLASALSAALLLVVLVPAIIAAVRRKEA